jgi:hypothetical protein
VRSNKVWYKFDEGEWLGGFLKFIGKGNDYIAELGEFMKGSSL